MAKQRERGVDFIGVGVGAVIFNDREEVLLLYRRKPPEAHQWTIPGGAVEWYEKCADAIIRECLEEVGLEIKIERILTVVDHIVPADGEHWVSVEYLARPVLGEVSNAAQEENHTFKWFPLEALPELMTQPTKEALECYLRLRDGI